MAGILFFLSSGLFLGWSLGANDAANVFGTAVASRMIRFSTAALVGSCCVVLGAVTAGSGAAEGLTKVANVDAMAGAFTVALSAAVTVAWMTRAGLPVSTSQAIIGALVGWNLFAGKAPNLHELARVASTWVGCPILAALFAWVLYHVTALVIRLLRLHLLWQDQLLRLGLLLAGAFGAYSLGANNIGNVMGPFLTSAPFAPLRIGSVELLDARQILFLIGALAIAAGIVTYSQRVMIVVGRQLLPLNPVAAWVVVVAHSLVLLIFSSPALNDFLASYHLPSIPLIPVSSSQAIVGAVLGVALAQARGKAVRQFRWSKLAGIAVGWVATPIAAGILGYVLLFIVQNIFHEPVYGATP